MESPFKRHRDVILGHYSTAHHLRMCVMSLWNGNDYPFKLHCIGGMDQRHYAIFQEMLESYRRHGEGDPEFMALAYEVRERMKAEATAEKAWPADDWSDS